MTMRNWADAIGPVTTGAAVTRLVTNGRREGLVYERVYEWRAYPSEAPMEKYRDDPNDPEEPVKERPARWWTERSIGFRAQILVNPLGGEVRQEVQRWIAYLSMSGSEDDHLKAIADRVIAWDYVMVDEHGERYPVPAPADDAEAGWQRFYDLPNDVLIWLKQEIHEAHLPKAVTTSTKRAGPTASTTPTTSDPDPEPPPS